MQLFIEKKKKCELKMNHVLLMNIEQELREIYNDDNIINCLVATVVRLLFFISILSILYVYFMLTQRFS